MVYTRHLEGFFVAAGVFRSKTKKAAVKIPGSMSISTELYLSTSLSIYYLSSIYNYINR